jgi:hypothetical protein
MVNTPIRGLRAGTSFQRFKQPSFGNPAEKDIFTINGFSVDGDFERFFVRSEYVKLGMDQMDVGLSYAQAGVHVLPHLSVNAQYELSRFTMDTPFGAIEQTSLQDAALGVKYAVSPNLALKLEGHRVRGYSFDSFVDPMGPKGRSNYVISSLSVSF